MNQVSTRNDFNKNERIVKSIWTFLIFAFLFGGVLPTFGVIGINHLKCANLIPSQYQERFYVVAGFSLTTTGILITCSALTYQKSPWSSRIMLYFGAVISALALHYFVHATGGSTQSLFSFHYMFIPAVVAITFDGRVGLVISTLASCGSCYFNLFPANDPIISNTTELSTIVNSNEYKLAFFCIFTFQLFVAVLIDVWVGRKKN